MQHLPENFSGATSDEHLVELWLHGRPESSKKVYEPTAMHLLHELQSGLQGATVAEVIQWANSLVGAPATIAKKISSIKSLLSFAHRTGYTLFNVGLPLRCPQVPNKLHERIVEEADVHSVIKATRTGRDRVLVRFLYASGARISEVVRLRHMDVVGNRVTLQGKGNKVRTVWVPTTISDDLRSLRMNNEADDAPVFKSYRGRPLDERNARQVVGQSADEAGLKMTPHYFRHAHASHALDNGCAIHTLAENLGHANVATTSRYLHARPESGSSTYLKLV
jgi:integrase/recombinase XerD